MIVLMMIERGLTKNCGCTISLGGLVLLGAAGEELRIWTHCLIPRAGRRRVCHMSFCRLTVEENLGWNTCRAIRHQNERAELK